MAYTDEFRQESLALLDGNGGNIKRTARQLDIPESTLRYWRDQEGADFRAQKKGELSEIIREELRAIFAEMEIKRKDASYRELATAAGILTDKMQLLDGDPTSINQYSWRDVVEGARNSNGHR
jgi:transposase-like protein